MNDQRTQNTLWRQNADGSWEPLPLAVSARPGGGGGNPGGGSAFLTEFEVIGGDNIVVEHQGDGSIVLRRGGHVIASETVPQTFRTQLNFEGAGVEVVDDAAQDRTTIRVAGGEGATSTMVWRGEYDPAVIYRPQDVVSYDDGIFVFTGPPFFFGYGFGPYGGGPYGAGSQLEDGFGVGGYGEGPYGF